MHWPNGNVKDLQLSALGLTYFWPVDGFQSASRRWRAPISVRPWRRSRLLPRASARTMRRDCSLRLPWRTCSRQRAHPRDFASPRGERVTGKAFWIGSLPQPPDEEEETDDESDGEESEEEHELDAEGAAVQVRTSHFSPVPSAHDPLTREKPASTQISRPWPFFLFFPAALHATRRPRPRDERGASHDDTCARARSPICDSRFLHPPKTKEFKIAKLREERREEAERMYRLWKEAPEQWLLVEDRLVDAARVAARRRARRRCPWRGRARLTRLGGRPAAAAGPPTPASARARARGRRAAGSPRPGAAWFRSRCSSPRA